MLTRIEMVWFRVLESGYGCTKQQQAAIHQITRRGFKLHKLLNDRILLAA